MKKRIYGIETEFGIALITMKNEWFCNLSRLSSYLENLYGFQKQFYPNGSRIYLDSGYHPEYCTAECTSLFDLIAQDKAGERILMEIFSRPKTEMAREFEAKKILLFKNNVQYGSDDDDDKKKPVTFGCHENFLTEAKLGVEDLGQVLIPFLVARQIFSGAGWVTNKIYQARKIRYTISQRARFIGKEIGDITNRAEDYYLDFIPSSEEEARDYLNKRLDSGISQRAILCTARLNEPHADARKYQRLHLILGDSNMSEVCDFLKMGSVGLLLEMMEEGYCFDKWVKNLKLKNPTKSLQLISRDLTCKKPVIELENGKFISAIDMTWEYVHMMARYERIQGLNPEFAEVKKRLIDILWRLERRKINPETLMEEDSYGLDEEIDWLIKKSILENILKVFDCHWNNFSEKLVQLEDGEVSVYDKLRAKDLKYHDISAEGLYYSWQPQLSLSDLRALKMRTPRMIGEEKIVKMMKNPPQNNRAKLRGDFIKLIIEKSQQHNFSIDWGKINWHFYYHGNTRSGIILLSDPFATENDELAKISSFIEKDDLLNLPSTDGRQECWDDLLRGRGYNIE